MMTDSRGTKYLDVYEAMQKLGVQRSTFDRMIADAKIQKFKRARDKKHYYRLQDIESLKAQPNEFRPVNEPEKELAAAS